MAFISATRLVIGRKTAIIANRQPQQMSALALARAQEIARKTVLALGGYGLFGVELFVCGDEMIFSEVSLVRTIPGWLR